MESKLKPIKWFTSKEKDYASTATIICEYDIYRYDNELCRSKEDIVKSSMIDTWVVAYYNRQTEEPTKEALGFNSMEDAKLWCWNNYNMHMSQYLI